MRRAFQLRAWRSKGDNASVQYHWWLGLQLTYARFDTRRSVRTKSITGKKVTRQLSECCSTSAAVSTYHWPASRAIQRRALCRSALSLWAPPTLRVLLLLLEDRNGSGQAGDRASLSTLPYRHSHACGWCWAPAASTCACPSCSADRHTRSFCA